MVKCPECNHSEMAHQYDAEKKRWVCEVHRPRKCPCERDKRWFDKELKKDG